MTVNCDKSDKLRRCPFCGGVAKLALVMGRVGIICQTPECPALMRAKSFDTDQKDIIDAWNRRK